MTDSANNVMKPRDLVRLGCLHLFGHTLYREHAIVQSVRWTSFPS
jgi:hypothetical protein